MIAKSAMNNKLWNLRTVNMRINSGYSKMLIVLFLKIPSLLGMGVNSAIKSVTFGRMVVWVNVMPAMPNIHLVNL